MSIMNALAAKVSELAEFHVHGISATMTQPDGADAPASGIYNADGSIYTGFYQDFHGLLKDERDKVIAE